MKTKRHCYIFSSFCGFCPRPNRCSALDPGGWLPSLDLCLWWGNCAKVLRGDRRHWSQNFSVSNNIHMKVQTVQLAVVTLVTVTCSTALRWHSSTSKCSLIRDSHWSCRRKWTTTRLPMLSHNISTLIHIFSSSSDHKGIICCILLGIYGTGILSWGDDGGGHLLVWMEWPPARWSVSASVNLPFHHKVQKFSFWHRLTWVVPEKGP